LAIPAGALRASVEDQDRVRAYALARAADSLGAPLRAAQGYAAALAVSPGNETIASRALRQAVAAGDRGLAVKAARALESAESPPPDALFVLLTESVRTGSWSEAGRHIDSLGEDEVFSFMVPVLRAWVALGARGEDTMALLEKGAADPLAGSYVAEHRPLLMLALGREKEGLIALRSRIEAQDVRSDRLALAGAARLLRQGDRKEALALLSGEGPMVIAARAAAATRRRLPGEIATAQQGVAELYLRLAIDLARQDVRALALSFVRLATFLEPENAESWLIAAELLASQEQEREALRALANIRADDPAADLAADLKVKWLAAIGEKAAALVQAETAVRRKTGDSADWVRLGDLYGELQRHGESADAYGRALAVYRPGIISRPVWALWLLRAGALDEAGDWPQARAALMEAHRIAPNEPLVLNYLGYAQLERRENIGEAQKLILEASRLQPESAQITDSLGWAHYIQGDVAKAIELLERAVQGEPTDAAINEHLGDAYYSAGRRYEARYAWTAALHTAEEKDISRLRAKIEDGLRPELASP
jgi:tetratricopeptide (TPR) repeat protein